MKVSFYLKENEKQSLSLIIMSVSFDGKRLRMSTGLNVQSVYWNSRTKRVKARMEVNYQRINEKLEVYEQITRSVYKEVDELGVNVTTYQLKGLIKDAMLTPQEQLKKKDFWEYFEIFLEEKRVKVSHDVVKDYHYSLRKHLKQVEKRYGMPLNFAVLRNVPGGFVEKLEYYMTYEAPLYSGDFGLSVNTIGKNFKNLKAYLNWCFEKEIIPPFSLRHMVTRSEEVDSVYITQDELIKLESIPILTSAEEKVRDMFLIGCETGLRFSDFSRLSADHIQGNDIKMRHKKTKVKVIIPISHRLRLILNKYQEKEFPRYQNITKFNNTLKEMCDRAGINSVVLINRKRGKESYVERKKKYELVSSHTARRTFCTLKFLQGMPAQAIMKFSGHSCERVFMRYLKLDAEVAADKYRGYFK